MNTAEDSTLEAAVRVGFPVFFHLVMEGALWIPDFRRDWFSFEWLPSSCWIRFRFLLLCEPALFNGSLTLAFTALHQVLILNVFFPYLYYRIDRQTKSTWKMPEYFVPFRALLTVGGEPFHCDSFKSTLTLCSCLLFYLSPHPLPQTHVQVIHAFICRFIDSF